MDNERQEQQKPPLPPQQPVGPSARDLWQYDQQSPGLPAPQPPPYPPVTAQYPPADRGKKAKPPPARYQEPIADMGTSLGYGQSMEYQYFDVPQPSQPMEQIRMERLQQLRQDRARQELQHNRPDITIIARKPTRGSISSPLQSIHPMPPPSSPLPYSQPLEEDNEPTVVRPRPFPAPGLTPASESAQDTGRIRKISMGRASLILTGAFVASRVLGLLRTSFFSATFGTGQASDTFVQASLVPDTLFAIVAGGALSSAFIPVFTNYMAGKRDSEGAWHVANTALTLATTIMIVLAIVAAIFAKPIVMLYTPGTPPAEIDFIVTLMRLMFIQAVVLGSGVIINAVLNARQNFTLPAIGIALYNIGPIVGLLPGLFFKLTGHPNETLALYCASGGVVLAAILQVGVQIPGLSKVGMHFRPSFDWRHPGVGQIGRQMVPRIINAAMFSFSVFVDRILIGLLGSAVPKGQTIDGLVTQYYQASQLVLLPLGIFGMAISTAAFPTLAEYVSRGKMDRVRNVILETLRSILFLSIPSSIGLIVLSLPIIQALLEHGGYSLASAKSTAVPLAFYATGLAGLAAVEILTRSFYAMRDSRTPVIISVAQFVFKIALSILLIGPFVAIGSVQWGMGALSFSTALASLLEAIFLFWILHQRIGDLMQNSLFTFIGRVLLASAGMGVGVFIVRFVLDFFLNTTDIGSSRFIHGTPGVLASLAKVIIELLVGTFIYLRLARWLRFEELGPMKRLLDRFKLSWMI